MKTSLLTILFFVCYTNAFSCKCTGSAENSNMEMTIEWYNDHEFVFSASVDSVKTINTYTQKVFLSTKTVYKGNVPKTLTIAPPFFGSSCGFDFTGKEGLNYIFYADKDDNGTINTHFCQGSKRLYTEKQLDTLKQFDFQKPRWRHELKFLEAVAVQKNGMVEFKYSNGKLQSKGELKDGLPVGKWTYYNFYGEKISEGEYTNGRRTGEWTEYLYSIDFLGKEDDYAKAKLIPEGYVKGTYVKGLKQGEWRKFKVSNEYSSSTFYHLGEQVETIEETK